MKRLGLVWALAALAPGAALAQPGGDPPAPDGRASMAGGDASRSGRSALRGPRARPRVLWRFRTGRRVFSSPAVDARGWAVFGSLDGTVRAVDAAGVERWVWTGESPVFSSPAVWGDTALFGHDGDAWVAVDARGRQRWAVPSPDDADSAPLVGPDGTVYLPSRGLTAVAPDGTVRWRTNLGGHVFGWMSLGAGGRLFVPELSGAVVVVSASDGRVERRHALPGPLHGGVLALEDGGFVVGCEDGHVRAFDAAGAVRWDAATDGAARGRGVRATPALGLDGVVVVGADDGGVYGLRLTDGSRVFRAATGGPVRSGARVDAEGYYYVGSEDDQVYALDPSGAVAWSVSLGSDVDSTPAILPGGTLVAGCDDGALYALGE